MPEDHTPAVQPATTPAEVLPAAPRPKHAGHSFPPGHPRFGGKPRNSVKRARELAASLGVDPLEVMLKAITMGTLKLASFDAKGRRCMRNEPLNADQILDLLKYTARFLDPQLSAVATKDFTEKPRERLLPIEAILRTPGAVKAYEAAWEAISKAEHATALDAAPAREREPR